MNICILGANGKVGTELCLLLKYHFDMNPIGVVRSNYAGSFLRHAGIECRCGDIRDPIDAERFLADADIVVDLADAAQGSARELASIPRTNIDAVARFAQPSVPYLYASSVLAYGAPRDGTNKARSYLVPWTISAYKKRAGERYARKMGRRTGRAVYALRLGQVHGAFQPVTRQMTARVREARGSIRIPNTPAQVIFVFNIAEAIVAISKGRLAEGLYCAVIEPAVRWDELLLFVSGSSVADVDFELYDNDCPRIDLSSFPFSPTTIVNFLLGRRDIPRILLPAFETSWQRPYFRAQARRQIATDRAVGEPAMSRIDAFRGVFPGRRLPDISGPGEAIREAHRKIEETVESRIPTTPHRPGQPMGGM